MFSTSAGMTPPYPAVDFTSWPDALEPYRLDDTSLAQGFDSLSPSQRAAIKTGVAMHFTLHGEHNALSQHCVHDRTKGFSYKAGTAPIAWAVLCISADFAAGPRLVAALMPAVLAGVPLLGVVCVGGEISSNVCGCLELMGIEHVFCVPDVASAEQFLGHCCTRLGPLGRALFLHHGELTPLHQAVQSLGLRCWQEDTPPRIALHSSMEQTDALIAWCHPDAIRVSTPDAARTTEQGTQIDVLFTAHTDTPSHSQVPFSPLVLGTGLEGFWWYPNLEPRFFLYKSLIACCFPDNFSKD